MESDFETPGREGHPRIHKTWVAAWADPAYPEGIHARELREDREEFETLKNREK